MLFANFRIPYCLSWWAQRSAPHAIASDELVCVCIVYKQKINEEEGISRADRLIWSICPAPKPNRNQLFFFIIGLLWNMRFSCLLSMLLEMEINQIITIIIRTFSYRTISFSHSAIGLTRPIMVGHCSSPVVNHHSLARSSWSAIVVYNSLTRSIMVGYHGRRSWPTNDKNVKNDKTDKE